METYQLYPIRCINCNRYIGHLPNQFNPLFDLKENFDIFNLNYCCRALLARPEIIVINKQNTLKMNGNKKEELKLTPLNNPNTNLIYNNINIGIPISYKLDSKMTKLTDDLYINYSTEATFIAQ